MPLVYSLILWIGFTVYHIKTVSTMREALIVQIFGIIHTSLPILLYKAYFCFELNTAKGKQEVTTEEGLQKENSLVFV